jgi:hypothetical protein
MQLQHRWLRRRLLSKARHRKRAPPQRDQQDRVAGRVTHSDARNECCAETKQSPAQES